MPGNPSLADLGSPAWAAVDLATLVFVVREGEILLIRKKRGLGAGKINGPGGRIDPGETPLECAVREVREELGTTPVGLSWCGEHRFQFLDGYSIHVQVFRAADCHPSPVETDEAVPLWVPIADIPYEEMWADDRLWLPHVLAGRRFSGRFLFDGDRMLAHAIDLDAGGTEGEFGGTGQAPPPSSRNVT